MEISKKAMAVSNPVLPSPWKNKFPNKSLGYFETYDKDKKVGKQAPFCVSRVYRPKREITNECIEHFHKVYPFFTKTQIRGAVLLADNDLILSKMLLDFKTKRHIEGIPNKENKQVQDSKNNDSHNRKSLPAANNPVSDAVDQVEKVGVAISRSKNGYSVKPLGNLN